MNEPMTSLKLTDAIMIALRMMLGKLHEMGYSAEQIADACLLAHSSLEVNRVGYDQFAKHIVDYARSVVDNKEPLSKSERMSLN